MLILKTLLEFSVIIKVSAERINMSLEEINVYCDESCHLENEACKTMVISCLRCPASKVKEISEDIIAIKKRHKMV